MVFDKTGTITVGKPQVTDVVGAEDTLAVAAALEDASAHPLALAIVQKAREAGLSVEPVTDFNNVAGEGVTARLAGQVIRVGSARLMAGLAYPAELQARERALQDEAKRSSWWPGATP